MKLTDALAHRLTENRITHAFGLQGGAVVHIFDSLENAGIGVTYTHHEQSAALAAVAHARLTGNTGCAVVTTGPGGTNAVTGVLAAWQDSIPCLFVSGQVRSQHTSYGRKVRQVGTQEAPICDIVRPITKYATFVRSLDEFLAELDKALQIARSGRPGPVWIDIPLEFQWSDIPYLSAPAAPPDHSDQSAHAKEALDFLRSADRPLLILGHGLRSAGDCSRRCATLEKLGIPFVTTWTAADLFPTSHPLNLGIIGMSGQRGANQAVFAADALCCLGTHLSIPHTTTLYDGYAPQARKAIVNIDQDQLDNLNIPFDLKIQADLGPFIDRLDVSTPPAHGWTNLETYRSANWHEPQSDIRPNSNTWVHRLTERVPKPMTLIVDGGGTALYAGFQASTLKQGDRIICSSAISAMGTGLAETIGAAKASAADRQLLCVIGDGSFLMNVQDLQTIRQDNINVIITVVNNNGYLAIRHTQRDFLNGRYHGTHPEWNLTMPSIERIAAAFDISFLRVERADAIDRSIGRLLEQQGPIICELVVDENQDVLFKQGYRANGDGTFSPLPLSDMATGA